MKYVIATVITMLGLVAALTLVTQQMSQATRADVDPTASAFLVDSGSLGGDGEVGTIRLVVDSSNFTMPGERVGFTFVLAPGADSSLQPHIGLSPVDGSPQPLEGPRHHSFNGTAASTALFDVAAGSYDIVVWGRGGSAGAYELGVSLTGDANGDHVVDDADIGMITGLLGTRGGRSGYAPAADVDRNGVINRGDLQRARANLGAARGAAPPPEEPPATDEPPATEEPPPPPATEEPPAAPTVTLVGLSSDTFNDRELPLRLSVSGGEFQTDVTTVSLSINGWAVPDWRITVEPTLLTATNALWEGRNEIALTAVGTGGEELTYHGAVWAGSYSQRVYLLGADGMPYTERTVVTTTLPDAPSVSAQDETSWGYVDVHHLPWATVRHDAVSQTGVTGGLDAHASTTTVEVQMGSG